jgi:hypothetical protein
MGRISIIALALALLCGCAGEPMQCKTVTAFQAKADGYNFVIDKSILRMVNSEQDPDFNALIRDLDNIKISSSDRGNKGTKVFFKELVKGVSEEGFDEIVAVDNKDISCRLFEGAAEDSESKWVLVFNALGQAGVVEMNGELDPAYLNSLSNLDFEKVKSLVESGIEKNEELHVEESYEVEEDL